MKKRILFICTNNSSRSQMAEGLVNHKLGDKIEAFSAGTKPTAVNPRAIQAMKEIGIDISGARSKNMDEFADKSFDYVITLCDSANEECPLFFGGVQKIHMGFDDPAVARGAEEEIMSIFRKVRDEIEDKLMKYFGKSEDGGSRGN